jgi:hypothetical protein
MFATDFQQVQATADPVAVWSAGAISVPGFFGVHSLFAVFSNANLLQQRHSSSPSGTCP